MKKSRRNKSIISLMVLGLMITHSICGQDITTVRATNGETGEHLNLEAVASVFGEARDLEDFEQRLNDPASGLSNLDLNDDQQVDYLRVVETVEKNTHLIAIQAVIGADLYQDVATVEVFKDKNNIEQVQLVGDVYLYGSAYIIEPVYVYRPPIFTVFWRPLYRPYRSVFYWGRYPKYFYPWRPVSIQSYRKNVYVSINRKHVYRRTTIRRSVAAPRMHITIRKTGGVTHYPSKSFRVKKQVVVVKKRSPKPVAVKKTKVVTVTKKKKVSKSNKPKKVVRKKIKKNS
ncbi:hypothetical protein ACFSTE_14270 [Aquimarina hainanensis]|uniref:DUF3300 domain-containing protein n=1 Tax=Aquimarina hainanensis TaxID=1578017 RepID=A0ABW5N972_9FLAO